MTRSSDRSISRQLFQLAWPIIGLNVLNVLALAVDTAMCGRLPNSEVVLTGLGYAAQFVFLILVFMIGLAVGTVALVSRAHGGDDADRLQRVLAQSTQLTVGIGIVVAIAGNLAAPHILGLLGSSPESTAAALPYLRLMLGGCVFYYLNILYGAVLRGVQNTRLPFLIALGSNVVNFAINYCLILGNFGFPQLGVRGAAIGTVVAYAVGAIAYVFLLSREYVRGVRLKVALQGLDRAMVRQLLRIGLPAALDMLILNAAFLSIVGMLGRLDQLAVAAHGIGMRIQALAFVPGLSVSQATGAMVGMALGSVDPERARSVTRASVLLCTGIMTVLALIVVVFAHPLVAVFDVAPHSELGELAVTWMRILGLGMPLVGPHIAFIGCLQGSGSTYSSLGINLVGTLVQVPLSLVLGFTLGMGVAGVWLAFPLSFLVKTSHGLVLYRRGRWARTGVRL